MKKMIEQLSDTMLEVGGGNYCPLQFHIELKELADIIKDFQDQIKPLALTEASKWHGQVYCGYEITKKAGGGRYNYDHIPQVIKCEYNASKWDESQRAAMVMLSLLLIGILYLKEELD